MRSIAKRLYLTLITLLPLTVPAQHKIYYPDRSIKVFAYGNEQTLAWCGGFNNPQFTMGDLNHDGLPDLVVFEPWVGISTFINKGTPGNPDYRYVPEYALTFPPLYDYLILADYNCDGIPDLFHQGNTGISVYKGYYNAQNRLAFTYYQDLFYSNDLNTHGPANAFNNPGDIPAIVDVDNDGDLDFISYNINGGFMEFYKNMRVELGLPCDSIHIELKDNCWGKVYQGFYRTHYLAQTCDNSSLQRQSEKTTHSGNTPCLFDWDMDGDYDYLDGSVSFNQMTFLQNGRIPLHPTGVDTMIYQDTMWQSAAGGTQINIPIWPAAFNIDIDQDGKKDLIIAPNGGSASQNYNNIWFYKNYTTPGSPDWRFQSDSFLADKAIDLGKAAYPTLFDYNKDGKPDLFIGSDGYSQGGGTLRSRISYYQNTSTPGNPSFTLQTNDFMGLNSYNFQGTSIAIGDIDNDGISDLIIGHSDGTLSYFKNIAASESVQPVWQMTQPTMVDGSSNPINVGDHAAPFIYDIDRDGKKDLIIGQGDGAIIYYRNISPAPGTIDLQLVNTQLGHIKSDPVHTSGGNSTPFIGHIDSSGIDYLLLGSTSGNIYKYTGFQTGDTTATYTLLDSQYSYIDSMHNSYSHLSTAFYGVYDNLRSAPVVGDIAGDGGLEMLVGDIRGGVKLYKYEDHDPEIVPSANECGKVTVYPNPATDELNVAWRGVLQPDVHISIINMAGQLLLTGNVPSSPEHTTVNVSMLPTGMYVCVLQSGVNRYYSKFTVVR